MKKVFLFLILLIGIAIGLAPWADGFLFKKMYYQQVAILAQQIQANEKDVKVEVQSYAAGWLQSVANVTISIKDETSPEKPVVFSIKSIIHHGPLVKVNNAWQKAYAYIESSVYLPAELNKLFPQQEQGFMQIHSRVSLDGNTWINHLSIPAISSGFVNWGGLSGEVNLVTVNGKLEKVNGSMNFGEFSVPAFMPSFPKFTILPISSTFDVRQQAMNEWSGNASSNTAGASAIWQDGSSFHAKNIARNSTYDSNDGLYSLNTIISMESLQLPAWLDLPTFAKIKYSLAIKNLDMRVVSQNYLKILTATTTVNMKLEVNSDFGPLLLTFNASLQALPKTKDEMKNNVNMDLEVRAAQALVEKVAINYYKSASRMPVTPELIKQVKVIFEAFQQQGYVQIDQNDYVIVYSRKGGDSVLNGKPVKDEDLKNIPVNLNKTIQNALVPKPVVKPVVVTPTVVVKPKEYHCYWLDSSSGENVWILVGNTNKVSCFTLDSCSGGGGRSMGGCYKWASSPNELGMPW